MDGVTAEKPTEVCVSRFDPNKSNIENALLFGRSSAYRCGEFDRKAVVAMLTIQGMEGGRKNMSQLGLAELYLSEFADSEGVLHVGEPGSRAPSINREYAGMIGKLVDDSLVDAQMEGHTPGDKAYVHQRVRRALEVFAQLKDQMPDNDTLGNWVAAVEKEPEIFRAALDLRKTVASKGGGNDWKFAPIPACSTARDIFFKIAPREEAMNANELAKRFNTMPRLGLLKMLEDCGYYEGKPGEGDGFSGIRGEVQWTARSSPSLFPGGDASFVHFDAPFSHPREVYGEAVQALRLPDYTGWESSTCWGPFSLIASAELESQYQSHWGEIATVKDTDKGVLVTFKKHSWMQDKVECLEDGGPPWFNGVSWQSSRTCQVTGKEQATHQESPTYFPKEAAKELKPKRMLSFLDGSSGKNGALACDHKTEGLDNFGFPLYVHSHGGDAFKTDDQVQYFFWPVKREASTRPAGK